MDHVSAILRAVEILRSGGLVAFPTETVYGLGANALDVKAVARVFDVKGRPRFDPLIVHISDSGWVEKLATVFPPKARLLAERFWPGPLTLVLPKGPAIPDLVTAGCSTVALRVPDHALAQELLRAVAVPIAAPSANPFGRISPTTAAHVREQLGETIDLVLDGGPCRIGVESTVLQVTEDRLILLRPGGTTVEEIEDAVGKVTAFALDRAGFESKGAASPGLLPQHYAPQTPLVLRGGDIGGAGAERTGRPQRSGLLAFGSGEDRSSFALVENLSGSGNMREAAANFFAALRRLDAAGLELIVAELLPEAGLGRAVNDRLRRAAHC